MSIHFQREIKNLIKYLNIYIADIFIEYEKQNGRIFKNINLYNEKIRKNLEDDNFTNWLVGRGVQCDKIQDTELLKYILEQMNNSQIYSSCLLKNTNFEDMSPCDIINTFARYHAEISFIVEDDS